MVLACVPKIKKMNNYDKMDEWEVGENKRREQKNWKKGNHTWDEGISKWVDLSRQIHSQNSHSKRTALSFLYDFKETQAGIGSFAFV